MAVSTLSRTEALGPPNLQAFAQVSLPCRDLAEGKGSIAGGTAVDLDETEYTTWTLPG